MAGDRHFAQAARAWCEQALARLLPDLDQRRQLPSLQEDTLSETVTKAKVSKWTAQAVM